MVIDTNAVLPLAVAFEGFQAIAGELLQVTQCPRPVQIKQLVTCRTFNRPEPHNQHNCVIHIKLGSRGGISRGWKVSSKSGAIQIAFSGFPNYLLVRNHRKTRFSSDSGLPKRKWGRLAATCP